MDFNFITVNGGDASLDIPPSILCQELLFLSFQRGKTALMMAAKRGKAGVVKILIDSGANLEAKDKVTITLIVSYVYLPPMIIFHAPQVV